SLAIVLIHKIKRLAQARQHAEAEHVDFQNAKCIEIILVPFDEGAFIHRRIADRHDFVEPAAGNDKATDMLGKMAWEAIAFPPDPTIRPPAPAWALQPDPAHSLFRHGPAATTPDR